MFYRKWVPFSPQAMEALYEIRLRLIVFAWLRMFKIGQRRDWVKISKNDLDLLYSHSLMILCTFLCHDL